MNDITYERWLQQYVVRRNEAYTREEWEAQRQSDKRRNARARRREEARKNG